MIRNLLTSITVSVFMAAIFTSCLSFNVNLGGGIWPIREVVIRKGTPDKILLIKIYGLIFDEPKKNLLGAELTPAITARIKEELICAEKDKSIKAILLKINSPGGSATTCDIIRDELIKFKKRTGIPVIVEMGDMAASGGVYISTAADKIIAQPTTVTGSIGVIMQKFNAKELFEKIGVINESIKSGDKKDASSFFRGYSDEERALFQEVILSLYERFISVIIEGRKGINEKKLREVADGRIFLSQKALEYGLIDKIGYDDDAIELTEQTAGIRGATIVTFSGSGNYTSNIYSKGTFENNGTVNFINIDLSFLEAANGISFLYILR